MSGATRRLACWAPLLGFAATSASAATPAHDAYYWLGEMNKASTVMVVEAGIVPRPLGKTIAGAVAKDIADAAADPKLRSGDYLQVEPRLIASGGPDVTRLHSGRSRQDLGATSRRLSEREQLLATFDSLLVTRTRLLDFAARNPGAIVPAYTWGVQAQPISFGHWMLAYGQALGRSADRLRQAFARTNQSPLGSAALGTSSFPVNRQRLADLLGFDGVIVNSLDANQISPIDTGLDLVSASASTALTVGTFIADLQAQYRMTTPWIILTEGELTGVSSIMPQKRNPVSLQQIRVMASEVEGDAVTFMFKAHNVPAGMGDYKDADPELALRHAAAMLDQLSAVLPQLKFDPARALAEVDADYSVTTELADTLQRNAGVPFRVGHHFASELVTFGRSARLRPAQIGYADARRIYAQAAADFKLPDTRLPLSEAEFRRALTAENMVATSKGRGGPQSAEVARMMQDQRASITQDHLWLDGTRAKLTTAAGQLEAAFQALR